MTILNIIVFAFLFRVLGGMFTKKNPITGEDENAVPRYISLPIVGVSIVLQVHDIWHLLAYGWLFYCVRLIPTNVLISATHGLYPRPDANWQWLRNLALHLSGNYKTYYWLGIVYGTLRAALALPAMIYLGSYWLLLQGFIYYLAGRLNQSKGVMIGEIVSGGIFGALI